MLRMNDELMLVEPSEEYFAELAAYRNDFLETAIPWTAADRFAGLMI